MQYNSLEFAALNWVIWARKPQSQTDWLWAERQGLYLWWMQGFLWTVPSRVALKASYPGNHWVLWALFSGTEKLPCEADHSNSYWALECVKFISTVPIFPHGVMVRYCDNSSLLQISKQFLMQKFVLPADRAAFINKHIC
jgi:hypothetical protein